MATWPASLPQQFEQGTTDNRQAGFIRTPTSTGPVKMRRRFSATVRFIQGTMLFTQAQRATFETFYQNTISEGSETIEFTDPEDGSTTASFRFVEPPSFSYLDAGFSRVTLSWERLPS